MKDALQFYKNEIPSLFPLGSEKQYYTLFKEEHIFNFCASCPLKPIHTIEKPVIGDT